MNEPDFLADGMAAAVDELETLLVVRMRSRFEDLGQEIADRDVTIADLRRKGEVLANALGSYLVGERYECAEAVAEAIGHIYKITLGDAPTVLKDKKEAALIILRAVHKSLSERIVDGCVTLSDLHSTQREDAGARELILQV